MKALYFLFATLLITSGLFAQVQDPAEQKKTSPYLTFNPTEINLGTVTVNEIPDDMGDVSLEVVNEGSQPLILNRVTACCGTRVIDWPTEPISPGQKGTVKVSFRVAPRAHRISRSITVYSNAANGNMLRIPIRGEVVMDGGSNEFNIR